MCGISGIYNCFGREIDSQKIIKKIVQLQHRRGPDGNGIWESKCKKVIFGHNRLSIIDLSTKANQPLVSRDKNYVITFNLQGKLVVEFMALISGYRWCSGAINVDRVVLIENPV